MLSITVDTGKGTTALIVPRALWALTPLKRGNGNSIPTLRIFTVVTGTRGDTIEGWWCRLNCDAIMGIYAMMIVIGVVPAVLSGQSLLTISLCQDSTLTGTEDKKEKSCTDDGDE